MIANITVLLILNEKKKMIHFFSNLTKVYIK